MICRILPLRPRGVKARVCIPPEKKTHSQETAQCSTSSTWSSGWQTMRRCQHVIIHQGTMFTTTGTALSRPRGPGEASKLVQQLIGRWDQYVNLMLSCLVGRLAFLCDKSGIQISFRVGTAWSSNLFSSILPMMLSLTRQGSLLTWNTACPL